VTDVPETRYAKTREGVHLAYQVLGDGPSDLIYLSDWDFAIDFQWEEPPQAQFFERLASFSRLILFDRRGTGASDTVSLVQMPTLESWVDDVDAVMDAVGSEQAAVMAETWAGPLAMLFAATHPERTSALVLVHTWARLRYAPDYPCGRSDSYIEDRIATVEREWGTGNIWATFAPSFSDDERLRQWWNRCNRLSISPAGAVAFTAMMADSDVRAVLPLIRVPCLVVTNENLEDAARGRYLVEHISGATAVQTTGRDRLPWLSDTLAGDIEEFLTGARRAPESNRVLATVLFTDIVASTEHATRLGDKAWAAVLDRHDAAIGRELARHRGRRVNPTGDGVLATFDGPARGVRCAQAIIDAVRPLGVDVRAGLHTGEVELRGDDIGGIAVHIGQRISSLAAPGEVLVSRTVTDLVAGSGLEFEDRGEHELKGVPGSSRVFALER